MSGSPRGQVVLHTDHAPLYVVEFVGVPQDGEFETYLDSMLAIARRGELHAMVMDATRAGVIPPHLRKRQAEWMREHEAINRATTAGMAFVLEGKLMRGLLTALFWMQRMPCPYAVMASREAAVRWCASALGNKGIKLSAAG